MLAATALFGSFSDTRRATGADERRSRDRRRRRDPDLGQLPNALVGLIIGAAVVFLFSGLAINAVGRAAGAVVYEVREQFRSKPGIMEGTERPEYGAVVDICTKDSLRELDHAGHCWRCWRRSRSASASASGRWRGFLAGAIAAGTLMAVFLANSGGAWDNAKKLVEDGNHGGKGSDAHAATVIGDTVGDPFKDTAGPAINPLIKVMNLVSLLIAAADRLVLRRQGPERLRCASRSRSWRSLIIVARSTSPSGAAPPSRTPDRPRRRPRPRPRRELASERYELREARAVIRPGLSAFGQ